LAKLSKIEWTDSTWNPIRFRVKANAAQIARDKGYKSLVPIAEKKAGRIGQHCEHVSAGCEHCYAETNNHAAYRQTEPAFHTTAAAVTWLIRSSTRRFCCSR
jgi:hypothetical protein